MRPLTRLLFHPVILAAAALAVSPVANGQEPQSPADWAKVAARGVLDLCRQNAPDAAAVADHGEVWGWPAFMPYTEHLDGYRRDAGGQSRRSYTLGATTAEVEVTVQSGRVTAAAPADVRYFRCDIAANQPIAADMEGYLSGLYGAPASKTAAATVWLGGAAAGRDPGDDSGALAAVEAAGAGAEGVRVELTHELDRDMVKLTEFRATPVN